MQAFKIENYEREHGFGTFVPFRHLSEGESKSIKEAVAKYLRLPQGISVSNMVKAIQDKSIPVDGVNAEEVDFSLRKVLDRLRFDLSEVTYLNWYRYDDIDEIRTEDILAKFDEIWYPSADDLDLIDSNMKWLLSIHHSGTIRALNFERG
jgi:hypothetical protein